MDLTKHTTLNKDCMWFPVIILKKNLSANNSSWSVTLLINFIWGSTVGNGLTYLCNVCCVPAPCTPHNLVTYVECKNQVGSVSWSPSDGANMYTATAIGNDGHTHLCVTNGTSCTWEDLHCGEIYNVTVTANDSRCTSTRSNSTFIHMGKTL